MLKVKVKTPRVRTKAVRLRRPPRSVKYSFKFEGELNISPFVAQQTVNGYLLRRVANLITSDEPHLELRPEGAFWIVPVVLSIPKIGRLGPIGQIIVDAQNGIIIEDESTSCEEIEKQADRLAPEEAL
jgi:hypothetical protein